MGVACTPTCGGAFGALEQAASETRATSRVERGGTRARSQRRASPRVKRARSNGEVRPHRRVIRRLFALALIAIDPRCGTHLRERLRREHVIDSKTLVLRKGQLPVIPPAELLLGGVQR